LSELIEANPLQEKKRCRLIHQGGMLYAYFEASDKVLTVLKCLGLGYDVRFILGGIFAGRFIQGLDVFLNIDFKKIGNSEFNAWVEIKKVKFD
jgi:hypothetical protein